MSTIHPCTSVDRYSSSKKDVLIEWLVATISVSHKYNAYARAASSSNALAILRS